MHKPDAMSVEQKRAFVELKSRLNIACNNGDIINGSTIVQQIRELLLPTGHHTKYREILLRFCEILILNREYNKANHYLDSIVQNVHYNTRLFQEANVLLAISKMHTNNLNESERYIKNALDSKAITNRIRREKFIKFIGEFLEEESLITSFEWRRIDTNEDEIIIKINENFARNYTEEELLDGIGRIAPKQSIDFMHRMNDMAQRQLTYEEKKMLPPPPNSNETKIIGTRIYNALMNRLYLTLCKKDSSTQKILSTITNPDSIIATIIRETITFIHPPTGVIANIATIVIKQGINNYCKNKKHSFVMNHRYKST